MSLADLFDHFTAKPKTTTWVIANFEEIASSEFCQSPPIKLASSFECQLYLRPNDSAPDYYGSHVFIYLTSLRNLEIYYRISLINEKGLKCKSQEGRAEIGYNFASRNNLMKFSGQFIINRSYLLDRQNGLLPNGTLTIYCEIFELDDAQCIESGVNRDNLVGLAQDNRTLLDSGKLSDVVLVLVQASGERRQFKAHKLILSARSVVFEKMFEHDLEEKKQNRVTITDMSAGACEDLLAFIYTGKVRDLAQNVHELVAAAEKYQIETLKSHCEHYLALSLSVATVPKTFEYANLYSMAELKSKCLNYIKLHSSEFKSEDWEKLTFGRTGVLDKVFKTAANKRE